ncbi:MAG: chemotaxis protein CheW [Cellvibrionaceae bacterium]|nr:chemotaxis protein CheW [Cellvibrionaceae bacterium]
MNKPVSTIETINEIPSLLIPMVEGQLLLPTVSVAEMIPYQTPQPSPSLAGKNQPPWYLGELSWRGVTVPMLSYEAINGGVTAEVQATSQVAILNNTGVSEQLPFIAMLTQGIPHLSRVVATEISENTDTPVKDYDQMQVFIAGEQAIVPNISRLERACIDLLGLS